MTERNLLGAEVSQETNRRDGGRRISLVDLSGAGLAVLAGCQTTNASIDNSMVMHWRALTFGFSSHGNVAPDQPYQGTAPRIHLSRKSSNHAFIGAL